MEEGGAREASPKASPPTNNGALAGDPSDLPARSAAQMARVHVILMQSTALRAADSVLRFQADEFGSMEPEAVAAAPRAPVADAGGTASAVPVVTALFA